MADARGWHPLVGWPVRGSSRVICLLLALVSMPWEINGYQGQMGSGKRLNLRGGGRNSTSSASASFAKKIEEKLNARGGRADSGGGKHLGGLGNKLDSKGKGIEVEEVDKSQFDERKYVFFYT